MTDAKSRFGRTVRALFLISASIALADCAVASTPAKEAAEKSAQDVVVREQLLPVLRLARAARDAGDLSSAVNLYRTALNGQPDDAALTVEFADTLQDAGAFDEAINAYNKANGKMPRLDGLLGLARVHLALGQADKALGFAEQARALAPTESRVLITRGVALDMLGRHPEAQGSYRAVLEVQPRSVAARNDLALSLALAGQYPEALDILTPMAKSTTAPPRVRQNLALVYGLMGNKARATELSRVDLDKEATEANLRFFDYARSEMP
ncbi:MAG TPA: tetratricopeptide repeat protein [Micropepsaceae bacterium]|nr:tetratricopeptide repeat protein [Micropepsaceae bacterium]